MWLCRQMMRCLASLAGDESEHVRASLASVIMGMAPLLGRERTTEHLLPLFLQLLKDSTSQVGQADVQPAHRTLNWLSVTVCAARRRCDSTSSRSWRL